MQQSINIFQHIKNLLRTNYSSILKYAAIHILMRQLYFIAALLALCSCIQFSSLVFMARSTTYESARVSVATFMCDVDECTFEGNCSKSLKRHQLTHSAALLHCDFMGCSYETKESSHLKRHKLSHTKKAEKAIAKEKEMTVKCATKAEQSRACEDGNTIQFMDLSMGLETLR